MKKLITLIAIVQLLILDFAATAEPDKNMAWFRRLHPAMQFYLFERNQYRKVRENDIKFLLPLDIIDLRLFSDVYDLSFLKDFSCVEKLLLPPSVNDFSALTEVNLYNLKYLDLSFTNICEEDVERMKSINIETINLSGTKIKNFKFVENLSKLKEIILLPNQAIKSEIIKLTNSKPELIITYQEITSLQNNSIVTEQINDYINYFDATYGAFSNLPKEFKIDMVISPEGRINRVYIICKKREPHLVEDMLSKIILGRRFDNQEQQLIIPIKKQQ